MSEGQELDAGPMSTLGGEGTAPTDEARLGYGAGGVVLRGEDRHLPREVAWKVARGAHAKALLAHEAHVLAALDHPAIVPIHDLVEGEDDSLRIALRLVRGETLYEVIRRAPDVHSRLRLVRPFLQAVEAVAWAHRVGWVHRDLKPSNIMVGEFGETQVIDWGLAEHLDDPTTPPGVVVGTPATMSPEQARGEAAATTFDVWGLGATLFELVSGRALFAGVSAKDALARLRLGDLPDLALPDIPRELRAIITRCLEPVPAHRYPDAHALAQDLSAWLDGRRVQAHSYSALELSGRFVRAWRLPLGVLFAAIVTSIIAAVFAFDRIGDERDEALKAKSLAEEAVRERDEQIATSGISEAQRSLAQFLRPEAELAAARALAVRESPEARGVLLAFSAMPRPERHASRPLPTDCLDVRASLDGRALCVRQDQVELVGGWTHRLPVREAAFVGSRVVVAPPDGSHRVLDAGGRLIESYPASVCNGRLTTDPSNKVGLDLGHFCAELFIDTRRVRIDPCNGRHIEVGAVWPADGGARFAGLCIGGDLTVVEPDGSSRRIRAVMPDVDTLLSAVHIDQDHLLVGGSRGELTVLSILTGKVVRSATAPSRGGIRGMMPMPGVDRLAIEGLAGDLALVTLGSFTELSSLPLKQTRIAGLVQTPSGVGLATAGPTLETWLFSTGFPARFNALGGVTHAHLEGRTLIVTHDRSATVLDLVSGRVEASATWTNVIAKQATLSGRRLSVGLASYPDGDHLTSFRDSSTDGRVLVELPAIRRVASLSRGRMIGGRTGLGLVFWRAGDPEWKQVSERLVTDLATLDDRVAVLFTSPREAVLYEAAGDPMPLAGCAVPGATAIALVRLAPWDEEATLLAVTAVGIRAFRFDGSADSPVGQCPLLMTFGEERGGFLRAAATADGRFVAGGTRAGMVHVWRADGERVASLSAHTSAVSTLTASGSILVSGAWDGRVQLMDLVVLDTDRGRLVEDIRAAWGNPR